MRRQRLAKLEEGLSRARQEAEGVDGELLTLREELRQCKGRGDAAEASLRQAEEADNMQQQQQGGGGLI